MIFGNISLNMSGVDYLIVLLFWLIFMYALGLFLLWQYLKQYKKEKELMEVKLEE